MSDKRGRIRQAPWPRDEAFLDLGSATQHTDGRARCIRVAVCDAKRQAVRTFHQGQFAHIFCEFEVLESIEGMVFGGVEIHSRTGVVVHGKSSFQVSPPVLFRGTRGKRVRFHHVAKLTLGSGEYTLGVGLASASEESLDRYLKGGVPYTSFASSITEHARAMAVTTFEVGFGPAGALSHHGLSDLPSRARATVVDSPVEGVGPEPARIEPVLPTVFHVTHWKAGSQWINKILHDCVSDRIIEPVVGEVQFLHRPIVAGGVYPTVYVTKQQFDSVTTPIDSRRFVVIRDIRDTLVSAYYSIKVSHPLIEETLATLRNTLGAQAMEDGLLYLMDEWLPPCARIQTSWLEAGERLIRYEDLLSDDIGILEPLLFETCELPVSRERLREIIEQNRFEQVTGGRPRGVEDIRAHERKGVSGDWRNHFTPRVKDAFKLRHGGLLVATGYEKDLDW